MILNFQTALRETALSWDFLFIFKKKFPGTLLHILHGVCPESRQCTKRDGCLMHENLIQYYYKERSKRINRTSWLKEDATNKNRSKKLFAKRSRGTYRASYFLLDFFWKEALNFLNIWFAQNVEKVWIFILNHCTHWFDLKTRQVCVKFHFFFHL